jgi:hypothetical protein
MTSLGYVIVLVIGAASAIARFVRTPDPDRPRAYPREPDRWAGMGDRRGGVRDALGTVLFYGIAAAASGASGAILAATMPAGERTSLLVGLAALAIGAGAASFASRRLLAAGSGAMRALPRASKARGVRPRVLFIGGSPNQTTQMHAIAKALAKTMPEVEAWFTPYYADDWFARSLTKLRALEPAILGFRRRGICLDYLNAQGLTVDLCAERNEYDAVVTCNDQVRPSVLADTPWVLVQEGIQEPPNWRTWLWRRTHAIPAALAGTATFGLSNEYAIFCVASEGYRENYLAEGIPADKLVVTGIPNFDDFARFRDNTFPHRGYVLVCTSDARETLLKADRRALLERAVAIAGGRPLFFKLHPNEHVERATREIHEVAPHALVFATGSAEEMVANCDVLITEWSSVTFCGIALGKEVHSLHPMAELERLLPLQGGRAAEAIASVVRDILEEAHGPHAPHAFSSKPLEGKVLS